MDEVYGQVRPECLVWGNAIGSDSNDPPCKWLVIAAFTVQSFSNFTCKTASAPIARIENACSACSLVVRAFLAVFDPVRLLAGIQTFPLISVAAFQHFWSCAWNSYDRWSGISRHCVWRCNFPRNTVKNEQKLPQVGKALDLLRVAGVDDSWKLDLMCITA